MEKNILGRALELDTLKSGKSAHLDLGEIDNMLKQSGPFVLVFQKEPGGPVESQVLKDEKAFIWFAETEGFEFYHEVDLNGMIDLGISLLNLDSYSRDVLYNGGSLNIVTFNDCTAIAYEVADGVTPAAAAFERMDFAWFDVKLNTEADIRAYSRGDASPEACGIPSDDRIAQQRFKQRIFEFYQGGHAARSAPSSAFTETLN